MALLEKFQYKDSLF